MIPVSVSIEIPACGISKLKLRARTPPVVLDVVPPDPRKAVEYFAIPEVVTISPPL